jgi:hypothetical protein
MKKTAFIILFLLGITQIAFGLIFGRLRIYAIESPFWHALGLSAEHSEAFSHYIGLIKDQWHVVAWFGLIIILATSFLLWSHNQNKIEKD